MTTTARTHEVAIRFADYDLTGAAHHTTILHAADSWRLAVLEDWTGEPIMPSPITELNANYLKAVRPGRGPLIVSCETAVALDKDNLRTRLIIRQAANTVALLTTTQRMRGQAVSAVEAIQQWHRAPKPAAIT